MNEPHSFEYVDAILSYNPETGDLTWKSRPVEDFEKTAHFVNWEKNFAGKIAGHTTLCGRRRVCISGKRYLSHRVAWLLWYGSWPEAGLQIDHIDMDTLNNRIANLRLATNAQNQHNKRIGPLNTSGVKGVEFKKNINRWVARIAYNKTKKTIGRYKTKDEAITAITAARIKLHGEFARFC